jgi:hypothetical protein
MKTLHDIGLSTHTDKAYDHHFCDFYEKNLKKDVSNLWEIGVLNGASLQMWSEYFPQAQITGFDIEDKSQLKLNANVIVKFLDQGNEEQLKKLVNENKDIDVIVDDGSHIIEHQIMTFEILFDALKPGGQFIIEDLHTSTDLWNVFHYKNGKGTLQYLNDIIQNITPGGYPGQRKTNEVISKIKSIQIFSNLGTDKGRSITAIITKK